jgi:hypothetical protein
MSDAVEDTYSVKSMTRTRVVLPIFVVNQINYLQFINLWKATSISLQGSVNIFDYVSCEAIYWHIWWGEVGPKEADSKGQSNGKWNLVLL